MSSIFKKMHRGVKQVFERYDYLKENATQQDLLRKTRQQLIIAVSFFILSVANKLVDSDFMLVLTLIGGVANLVCAFVSRKAERMEISAYSSITTCSVLFAFFVIYGGNDGFAALWVILLPFFAMVVMDFIFGLVMTIFFQIFLIVILWTPLRFELFYQYNDEFCLRFPLLYLVTNLLGLFLTISLQSSQYNDRIHLQELEIMTEKAENLANTDPLTGLANRRRAYETFREDFEKSESPYCIVIGDIDWFKKANDTYGHSFGDEVLKTVSEIFKEQLPDDYLIVRWGGEEFLFAVKETLPEVFEKVEDIRKAVEAHEFHHEGQVIHLSMTFGICESSKERTLEQTINMADDRLYSGKNAGRNCTAAG